MIEISLSGSKLVITATAEYPLQDTQFGATWDAGSDWAARLLWHHLTRRLQNTLRQLREEAYAQGWKDAKAHRAKNVWFSSKW